MLASIAGLLSAAAALFRLASRIVAPEIQMEAQTPRPTATQGCGVSLSRLISI